MRVSSKCSKCKQISLFFEYQGFKSANSKLSRHFKSTLNQNKKAIQQQITKLDLPIWSFMACDNNLPSLISSINARPACFCSEFCHSCEHKSITSSTTEVEFLKVWMALPSINRSWPWEPTKVLERKGAKSTMISRSSGHTDPESENWKIGKSIDKNR